MATERTFVMLKPGVLQRRIVGDILARFERKGLRIVALKLTRMTPGMCALHYAEHRDKDFFPDLTAYMTSGPVVAAALEGESAVAAARHLCGPTAPEEAAPGTIRGDFGARTRKNIVHASDSPESAARELGIFFSPGDYQDWEDGNAGWFV
jgi:nucleoside-diphosphate kinase